MDIKAAILHLKKNDSRLSMVIDTIGSIQFHKHTDSFCFLVGEIVGQMLSKSVKKVIFNRLNDLCNNSITPVGICSLSIEQLRDIGLSTSKSSYIHNLANLVINNQINFTLLEALPDTEVIKYLTSIKGIGNWTAKMYLIFYLQREDVLPYEDGAFLQAYRWLYNTKRMEPKSISRKCSKWKPYTSIGALYLYRALDSGLTRTPINELIDEGK